MTDGPLLWYLNRSTGMVLLVLFTLTTVLGVLAAGRRQRRAGTGLPAFVPQSLHRNLALMALGLLVAHVTTAVVDTYVDIRWWQAFVPFGATYEPVWMALGALALDATLVIAVTSGLRNRLGLRTWRTVHLMSYAAWGMSVSHSWGIGTDVKADGWGLQLIIGCVGAVALALVVRLARLVRDRRTRVQLVGVTG